MPGSHVLAPAVCVVALSVVIGCGGGRPDLPGKDVADSFQTEVARHVRDYTVGICVRERTDGPGRYTCTVYDSLSSPVPSEVVCKPSGVCAYWFKTSENCWGPYAPKHTGCTPVEPGRTIAGSFTVRSRTASVWKRRVSVITLGLPISRVYAKPDCSCRCARRVPQRMGRCAPRTPDAPRGCDRRGRWRMDGTPVDRVHDLVRRCLRRDLPPLKRAQVLRTRFGGVSGSSVVPGRWVSGDADATRGHVRQPWG